jgi:phosphoribosylaminoimidazole carboxylase (NCAIR synthetase)
MIGFPAILKTTRLGYDGKGQVRLSKNSDIEKEYTKLKIMYLYMRALLILNLKFQLLPPVIYQDK